MFLKVLLQTANTANTVLSIADTSRSLVSSPQGSGTPDEVLAQNIQAMGDRVTAAVHQGVGVLRQELVTVETMLSHVIAQQGVLQREIQKVIGGIGELRHLMSSHMQTVEAQLRFVIEQSLQEAIQSLTNHLDSTSGIAATDEEKRRWLRALENWIMYDSTNPVINHTLPTLTSEVAATLLTKFPDNIGLIASRMRLLCGDEIPERFLSLPPIELYIIVLTLYLTALEKNPHLMSDKKAETVCARIEVTLKAYLEYFTFIKDNKQFIQALFDQYRYYQGKNPTQYRFLLEEIKALIKAQLPLVNNERFNAQLATLDAPSQQLIPMNPSTDIWDHLPKELPESERVKRLFVFLSQDNPPTASRTKYMLLSESAPYLPIPPKIQWATCGSPPDEVEPQWGGKNFPYKPKPPVFVSVSDLFLLLASGYADISLLKTTLKQHVNQLISHCSTSTTTITVVPSHRERRVRTCYSWGDDWYWAEDRPEWMSNSVGNMAGTETRFNPGIYHYYNANHSVYSGHRANIFEYHAKLTDELPKEYDALLKNLAQDDLEKYKQLFKYYVLYSQGRLKEAESFLTQHSFNQNYEKSYLLFLFFVAILGRWDIFEAFENKYPLIGQYSWIIKGGSLTPLMIAAQQGHEDVINGLLTKMSPAEIATQSFDKKTAAQLALKNGFYKIAHLIYQRGSGGLTATELATVQANLPNVQVAVPAQATTPSSYQTQIEGILGNVSASKTKLGQYVPPPTPSAAPAVPAAEMQLPDDSGDITSDEMEDRLHKVSNEFFAEQQMHAGSSSTSFWKKPTVGRHGRSGYRVIDDAVFNGDDQRNLFFGRLGNREFKVKRLKSEKQLLVQLPLMEP